MNRAETAGTTLQAAKVGALIRARRHSLRMTLQTLGDSSGVSIGYLSQVERDQASPSLSTLAAIARALEVGVDYFIAAPSTQDALTRAGERMRFSVNDSPIAYERLHSDFPGSVLSAFLITIAPGYRSETANHEGEEIIYVLEGDLTLHIEDEMTVVSQGDSLHFRGNRSHSWSNETDSDVRLMWSGTLTMFRTNQDGSAFQTNRGSGSDAES
ncbi:helix-turn-helix domain-containing protein [Pelagibacterium luteolum]|uniref:Helix-turn-helix domain-containing protein n=1 Tax=Pelagibacterium luteolum TaxID=440168 RepID=A0A1G7WAI8_9HYPH|nr:cupin domain-containing protein [Pelagibacterium luteolum]SDG68968.1 Helix-turn-helix domain-containing protein [Pelagibacterium luteolum]